MEIYKLYKKTQRTVWEVSNYGNIKKNGELYECSIIPSGYKKFADDYLHKIVAKLFIPNPDNKPQVDHIDTNKLNNHVDNLRWCTPKENQNNRLTIQHFSEVKKDNKSAATKCTYNGIEFDSKKDAWKYAVKYDGYDKFYTTFCRHYK